MWRVLVSAGCLLLLVGAAGVAVVLLRGRSEPPPFVAAQIGGVTLAYPPSYARFSPGRSGGNMERLELAFTFPDLRGSGAAATTLPPDDGSAANERQLVFASVHAPDANVSPSERTQNVYSRFLQSDVWQEDAGLVMRRFEPGSPYEREELHFVPPDGRVFAARCLRPTQPPSDLPSTCLAGLRIDGLDVDLRFSPTLLAQWDALSDGARRLIDTFVGRTKEE